MTPPTRLLGPLCIVVLALGLFAGTAVAVDEPAGDRLVVELDTDGDAETVYVETFDLTDDEQQAVFEDARTDDELRETAAAQFRASFQAVSDEANRGIDREIRVGEVTVETATEGDTGIVAYRFHWENLARVDGPRIVLSEPFSTFDSLDRELLVLAPEGGELTEISPQPERRGTDVASWPGLTPFGEAFEVVAIGPTEPTPEFAEGSTAYGGPIALAVSALLIATLLIGRQR